MTFINKWIKLALEATTINVFTQEEKNKQTL